MGKKRKRKVKKAKVASRPLSPAKRLKFSFFIFFRNPLNLLIFKFVALIILFYVFWISPFFQKNVVENVAVFYAEITGFVIKIFNYPILVAGDTLGDVNFSISIKNGCDGIEALAILMCGILVYPGSWKQKCAGLLMGTVLLVFINFIRIISLFFNGVYIPSIFEFMHTGVWQVLFIIFPLIIIFKWVNWINSTAKVTL